MNIHHVFLASLYPVLRCKFKIAHQMGRVKPRLRVLLFHDIALSDMDNFAAQLRWLSARWTFLTPDQFETILSGEAPLTSDSLLLTFDDGFKSNRVIAERILNPMGIQALFFIVPNFASMDSRDNARHFISKQIYPNLAVSDLPEHWINMSWNDIQYLLDQGHTIGSHTLNHARLSQIKNYNDLEYEINQSVILLEKHLGIQVEHFAYTFGDIASFSQEALLIASNRFRFVYSGLRGSNPLDNVTPIAIRRDSLSPSDPFFLVGSFLEGAADFHYKHSRTILDRWSSYIHNVSGDNREKI